MSIFSYTDTFIQKSKKNFEDSRSRRNLDNLNSQLNEVHKIVAQNIGDVLQRGEALSGLLILYNVTVL